MTDPTLTDAEREALARAIYKASESYMDDGVEWGNQYGTAAREARRQACAVESILAARIATIEAERDTAREQLAALIARVEDLADAIHCGAAINTGQRAKDMLDVASLIRAETLTADSTAALDRVRAEAWDEGHRHCACDRPGGTPHENPYAGGDL